MKEREGRGGESGLACSTCEDTVKPCMLDLSPCPVRECELYHTLSEYQLFTFIHCLDNSV